MNDSDSYICDAEEFGFPCTFPNCACDVLDDLRDDIVYEEDPDSDEDAYLED